MDQSQINPKPARQCIAITQSGERCFQDADYGPPQPLCRWHIEQVWKYFRAEEQRSLEALRLEHEREDREAVLAAQRHWKKAGYVYFFQSTENSLVKIGHSMNPRARRDQLFTGAGDLLVLGIEDGNQAREREIHAQFVDHRVRGEWFAPVEEILTYAASAPLTLEGVVPYPVKRKRAA